ncbi:heavy metal translocating P-type ATPase [Aliikangiella marina]|uniref:Heavy metal translocating P-type ATPase n=1 Tax=Aliikangiella marina TaxID=1712262 RepID=A0A545T346_9GAMM|nr:heavy metal translocating P-type ATPase [Aliikangiella marina]TQV71642.1 heavy metal translocating P-type ATPase [Aliikangiella marina]
MSLCYHCDLEVPEGSQFNTVVLGAQRAFCCPGCLAVAETICANGLEQFYQFRTEKSAKAEDLLPQELLEIEALDTPEILSAITENEDGLQTIELGIEGITCAACGWLLRTEIGQRDDVSKISVNTTTHRATLEFAQDARLSDILKNIHQLGYRAYPFSEDAQEAAIQQEDKRFVRRLIVAGLGMMQVMMYATGLYLGEYQDISSEHAYFLHSVSALLATPVVFYSAFPFFSSAWKGLKHGHFGMNLPVSIAILAGYFASMYSLITDGEVYYFDSVVMFTFFLLIGRFLEHRTRLKAILKQQNFKQLLPLSVQRLTPADKLETIPSAQIKEKDILLINAGAVIPIDGILVDQTAELNEAVITGEFLPVKKIKGDQVFSGSTNTGSSFYIEATSNPSESRLQKLIKLQQTSENLLSNKVSLADKIANFYVIGLLVLTVITSYIWWQIDPQNIFPVVLSLLVVSCPCALSLATPAAVAAAIAKLTDLGLMIKHRGFLNNLAEITSVYFDKTGTLTMSQMQLERTELYGKYSEKEVIAIAAALEQRSNHPIAQAFKNIQSEKLSIESDREVLSGGVSGIWNDKTFKLGKAEFVLDDLATITNKDQNKENEYEVGKVVIYLASEQQPVAKFVLADTLNPTAKKAIQSLHKQNKMITLLSGDTQRTCQAIAEQLAIERVIANSTPEAKLATISEAKSSGDKVLMVGDGVNDVGALAEANAGITMGETSYLSRTSSDAVLVTHDLTVLPKAISTAQQLNSVVRQNLAWAVTYNLFAIPFAMAGLVPAWLAAIGMTTSSLIVVLNALRLRN